MFIVFLSYFYVISSPSSLLSLSIIHRILPFISTFSLSLFFFAPSCLIVTSFPFLSSSHSVFVSVCLCVWSLRGSDVPCNDTPVGPSTSILLADPPPSSHLPLPSPPLPLTPSPPLPFSPHPRGKRRGPPSRPKLRPWDEEVLAEIIGAGEQLIMALFCVRAD